MKTLNYSILFIVSIIITLNVNARDNDEFTRKFHESYPVNKESLFEITNEFGTIKIENTDADNITIDAEIIIKETAENKAEKIFNAITIEISNVNNLITAKTTIEDLPSNASFSINYTVLMPKYLNINLNNKYGEVNINELEGKSNLNVKYGSLNVNRIADGNTKPLSSVTLGYCERSHINEFNWGTLIVKYSKIEVNSGKALVISSKYSKVSLGNFSSIVGEAGYDEYHIATVNNLVLEAKYSDLSVNEVSKKLNIDIKYGKVNIDAIPPGFDEINVVSRYTGVKLGISDAAEYLIDVNVSYADFKYNDLKIKERIKEGTGISLKGYSGTENAKATVRIDSDYGNVDIRPK